MFSSILRRAVFMELLKVFVPSLISITGIIVIAGVLTETMRMGLGPLQALAIIPLIVPSMLPFIVPPTTLFAACVVYGRLAHDNEITAIRAAGINILYVIWPGLFLGLTMSLATLGLYYYLIPQTQYLLRSTAGNDIEEYLYAVLRKDHELKPRSEFKLDYEMYVDQVQGRILKGVLFIRHDRHGVVDLVVKAKEAELHVDTELRELCVHVREAEGLTGNQGNGVALEQDIRISLSPDTKRKPTPRELTYQRILEERRNLERKKEEAQAELELAFTRSHLQEPPMDIEKHIGNLKNKVNEYDSWLLQLDTEVQMRPALAFGCFFFVLLGCPVGIWFSKSDYLSAFITCFLPIVFLYYPIQLCCTNLARDGRVSPIMALWAANGLLGGMALFLYHRLLRN